MEKNFKVGEKVRVYRDRGDFLETTVTHDSYEMPGMGHRKGTEVVHLEGISGWYACSHVDRASDPLRKEHPTTRLRLTKA